MKETTLRLATCIVAIQLLHYHASARGTLTNLFSFAFGGAYGGQPQGEMVRDDDGNLYGTTGIGGEADHGTAFRLAPDGELRWSLPFTGDSGRHPLGALVRDRFGYLYGVTSEGGRYGAGTVFKMSSDGMFIWFASFSGPDGAYPVAGLTESAVGHWYGTTAVGGIGGFGTVFSSSHSGRIKSLYSFTGAADGAQPMGALVRAQDGSLYGTAMHGGLIPAGKPRPGEAYAGYGTVFRLTPSGALTTLYSFGSVTNAEGTSLDGAYPVAGLTCASDHNFYGTTSRGGLGDAGTVFKLAPDGSLVWSVSFAITNGLMPSGRLLEGPDGNLYGTTLNGGENVLPGFFGIFGVGTLFRVTPDGVLTTLYSFGAAADSFGAPLDGAFPYAGLTRGGEGDFYGTASGGLFNPGTVFRFSIPESTPQRLIVDPGAGARIDLR
jgi:uncharacterized repeat protein (TIGR03803 family)